MTNKKHRVKPKTPVSFTINSDIVSRLDDYAYQKNVSRSSIMQCALINHLTALEKLEAEGVNSLAKAIIADNIL